MKLLVVLDVCILLAFGHIDAKPFNQRPSESFAELVANRTESMLSRDENPSTLSTLAYKATSMFKAAAWLHIQMTAQPLIADLTYTATRFMTPDRALSDIRELQKKILRSLSHLDNQRTADSSDEINRLIDDFINEYTESAAQTFENMLGLATRATEAIEPTSAYLVALIDELVQKIDACQNIQSIDFRQIFQCNKDYRSVENRITPEVANLRSAADNLYSDYLEEWKTFLPGFNKRLRELKEQIWNLHDMA